MMAVPSWIPTQRVASEAARPGVFAGRGNGPEREG